MSFIPTSFCQVENIRAVWLLGDAFQQNLRGWRKRLNATEKNPGQFMSPGSSAGCCLSFVGTFHLGGGVSGDGNAARVGPIN